MKKDKESVIYLEDKDSINNIIKVLEKYNFAG